MSQITAWQCDRTKKLFSDKVVYLKHLKTLARQDLNQRKYTRLRSEWKNWLTDERSKITRFEDIAPWLIRNQGKIMDAVNAHYNTGDDKFHDGDDFTKIEMSCCWSDLVSNSHHAPAGKPQNWSRKPSIPLGYPGFTGDVRCSLSRKKKHINNYPISSFLNIVGIHTGTGGGGNTSCNYAIFVYDEEWPGLVQGIQEDKVLHALKGTHGSARKLSTYHKKI